MIDILAAICPIEIVDIASCQAVIDDRRMLQRAMMMVMAMMNDASA